MSRYKGLAFFDIDGVLSNCEWRLPFVENNDLDGFYAPENIIKDEPIWQGIDLLNLFRQQGYKILITSARRESCREATMEWLKRYGVDFIDPEDIYLRADKDHRRAFAVKKDMVQEALVRYSVGEVFTHSHYFVDDYLPNCQMVAESFGDEITPLMFGVGRIDTKGM